MKKSILLILTIFFISCSNNERLKLDTEEANILGRWKLIEELNDPGDGSGIFVSVNSEMVVEFLEKGILSSNVNFCESSSILEGNIEYNYFVDESYILVGDCNNISIVDYKINYDFNIETGYLFFWHPCIEGCGQKFIKTE